MRIKFVILYGLMHEMLEFGNIFTSIFLGRTLYMQCSRQILGRNGVHIKGFDPAPVIKPKS